VRREAARPPGLQAGRAARPEVSVIICAYTERRWHDTLAAVASVAAQSLPALETIVVVDYNPSLFERLTSALPDVTVAANREAPGLSGGKNTGIALAQGDIIAFLDDDAVAAPDWLKFLVDSYADPRVAGVGGLTLPMWDTARPSWFPGEFDWVVGCTYTGIAASPAPLRNLLGGNASFRREVFTVAGGFRSGIGRSGRGLPAGCEETEFCIRLRQRSPGSVLRFDNRAVIGHRVPAARGKFSYFLTRCYAEGLSKALVTRSVGMADGLSAERSHALRTLPAGVAHGVADAVRGDEAGLGRAGAIVAGLSASVAGYVIGIARAAARRRSAAGRGDR
jgi:GT2 family glycosyltransferase